MAPASSKLSTPSAVAFGSAALILIIGAFLGFSTLFGIGPRGASAWTVVSILVVIGALDSDDVSIVARILFPLGALAVSLYGLINRIGFVGIVGIIVLAAVLTLVVHLVLASRDRARRRPGGDGTSADIGPDTMRAPVSMLRRYAEEHVRETGTRDPAAVVAALERRLAIRYMTVDPNVDLMLVAREAVDGADRPQEQDAPPDGDSREEGSVVATGVAPDGTGPSAVAMEPPRPDPPAAHERRDEPKPRRIVDFGTMEIDSVVRGFLSTRGDVDAETIIEHVLATLEVQDRSPLAISRLDASIARERLRLRQEEGHSDRDAERTEGLASTSSVMEFSSRDLESAVVRALDIDQRLSPEELIDAALLELGLDNRSPLGRDRLMRIVGRIREAVDAPTEQPLRDDRSAEAGDIAPDAPFGVTPGQATSEEEGGSSVTAEAAPPRSRDTTATSGVDVRGEGPAEDAGPTDATRIDGPPSTGLSLTANCYRVGGVWTLRIELDEQILSGAGKVIPVDFARHLGIPDHSRQDIRVTRRSDVMIDRQAGSARVTGLDGPASDMGLSVGDHIFLVAIARHGRRLQTRVLLGHELALLRPAQRAARLIGLPRRAPAEALPLALGLDKSAPLEEVVTALRIRGEDALAGMLEEDTRPFHLHDSPTPLSPDPARQRVEERASRTERRTARRPKTEERSTPERDPAEKSTNERRTARRPKTEDKGSRTTGGRSRRATKPADDDGPRQSAPDIKDIADLLGF